MMPVNYNFSRGSDTPTWQWLPAYAGTNASYHGFDCVYDNARYIYYVEQHGASSTSASTTWLMRFDTWTHGHQYIATTTSGNRGLALELDAVRNVLYIVHGAALTSWQVFNLNTTAVNICGVSCAAWSLTTMTPVLPAAADYSASIVMPNPVLSPATFESGAFTSGTTTTSINDTTAAFAEAMIGLQLRVTSGTRSGDKRYITAVAVGGTNLTLGSALGGTPSVGDTYVIELPSGTASATSTSSTLADTTATWTVNQYSNHDVVITAGTGAGQKRRIASNTATTLTLAGATTGNANTGNWSVTPDGTSTYTIQPSSDFLYYSSGSTGTGWYKIDLATGASAPTWTTLATWPATPGGGSNVLWMDDGGPFQMLMVRGSTTSTVYRYDIGLNTFSTPTWYAGSETFTTGSGSTVWDGQRKIIFQKDSSNRLYALNLATRMLEPLGTVPYAAPGAYDGKRLKYVRTTDGVDWLYAFRPGGSEFFRLPLEWGD